MMNGADFHELAKSLAGGCSPAERRSATSRAYYGAFHTVRELLVSIGITLPRGPESHTKVRQILDNSEDAELIRAGIKLSSLRTARNKADYDLADLDPEAAKTVHRNLAIAKEVIDSIGLIFHGGLKSRTRDGIRDYARNVLRLLVS
jgi:uncharacterized protein (UPF0332 family)